MSDDDELLRALGRVARERDAAPLEERPPLDELARARIAGEIVKRTAKPARSRVGWALAGFAAAAAVVVGLRWQSTDALPEYALRGTGAALVRGANAPSEGCVLHASAQGSFEVVAQPSAAVVNVVAHALVIRGGVTEALPAEVSAQGSVRVTGASRVLVGASELRIELGRSDKVERSLRCSIVQGTD